MAQWRIEDPEWRVFALVYIEGYDYQVAQFDPKLKEWSFFYWERMICVDPVKCSVWWHPLPRPPIGDRPFIDRVFALEK